MLKRANGQGDDGYDPNEVASSVNDALGVGGTAVSFGAVEQLPTADPRSMRALFLSGGGASGVYEAGVVQALVINGVKFSALCGTSIGSINSAAYAHFLSLRDTNSRSVNEAQARFLSSILYFWEYVDQSKITNLDSSPALNLASDLERLYVALSTITRFWTTNLSPDLGNVKPPPVDSSSPAIVRTRYQLRRLGAQIARILAWVNTALLLLPSLLGTLLALPLNLIRRALGRPASVGDLYTSTVAAIGKQLGLRLRPRAATPDPTRPSGSAKDTGLDQLLHDIVDGALSAYTPNADARAKRSLFGNDRIRGVLQTFPALRVYARPGDETSQIDSLPAVPALPDVSLAEFRQQAGAELRFTRTNMRNGNSEVSVPYPLATALTETSQSIMKTLGIENDPNLSISADKAASSHRLLAFVAALEARISLNLLLGNSPIKTGKFLVGNPSLIHAVMASSAFPAAFPPVTIDQIYPADKGDPDNLALRDICQLAAKYRASNPPQMPNQLDLIRSQHTPGAVLNQALATRIIDDIKAGRATPLQEFVAGCRNFNLPATIPDHDLAVAQLAACIVATWYDNYPIYGTDVDSTERGEVFCEQYNDGGAGDATPLGNAIDALEYLVGQTANPADNRDATHYVYFVHLGDAPQGVRDVGDGSEISPASGTLPPDTLNHYLFYEYILRYGELGKRAHYLADSKNAVRVHDYIAALRQLGQAQDQLLIKVVNIYPSIPLNATYAFDVRLGYNHSTNRRQIATGCSDTMTTLWQEVQANSGAVTPEVATRLRDWLVPGVMLTAAGTSDVPGPTFFCRNGRCMYRRECPFGDNARPSDEAQSLVFDYDPVSTEPSVAPVTPAPGLLPVSRRVACLLSRTILQTFYQRLLAAWPVLCYNTY